MYRRTMQLTGDAEDDAAAVWVGRRDLRHIENLPAPISAAAVQ